MARPKLSIDTEQLEALMRLKPTLEDTAAFFKCSEDTIERHIKSTQNLSFADFRRQKAVTTRFDLVRTATQKALDGDNCMLIFCLKNLCGWADKPLEPVDKGERVIRLAYSTCSCQKTEPQATLNGS